MKQKKVLMMILMCIFFAMGHNSVAMAEDELNNGLPEVITGMDENGNVYELDSSSGYVEETVSVQRGGSTKVVNFNTKSGSVTNYTEVGTGATGYTYGAYGADAAYLGTSGSKVKFMLSGVVGEVDASEVQLVDFDVVKSLSYYMISDGKLYHKIATNLNSTTYGSTLEQGVAPSYMKSGSKYYSYDGHYFYTDYETMLFDYGNESRENSINSSSPYFNYFQYLPLRSQSNYNGTDISNILNNRVSSNSKMRDLGTTFVQTQNLYGVNALLAVGVAANESAWGMSNISQTKNNLFGLNAVDSSPGEAANYYSDVKVCVKDFTETFLSKQYLNPSNWKYKGAFLGNKASGINVRYASDPYWGEKAANVAWVLDNANGNRDANTYSIGIKDLVSGEHTSLNVRKEASASSTRLYNTGGQSCHAFLILGEENGFYKIQSEPVLNSGRTAIDNTTGEYDFNAMYTYVSTSYVTKVYDGNKKPNNNVWKLNEITTNIQSPQMLETEIKVNAIVSNANNDLQYKYVWMKDDWNSWGIIQDFSSKNSVVWVPTEGGDYKIYVDVKDASGKTETIFINYSIKNWKIEGVNTNLKSPQEENTVIEISPKMKGNIEKLQYKYVWQKDNWADWGIIKDFFTDSAVKWQPDAIGDYTLYVDVKDEDGFMITKTMSFSIKDKIWEIKNIQVDHADNMELGETLHISANINNSNSNLKYKFVWMKDDWNKWGVIRDFSSGNSVNWTPEELGDYYLYMDVKDQKGNIESSRISYKIVQGKWAIDKIEMKPTDIQIVNKSTTITAHINGNKTGLQYKFVWMKDDWNEWGIIQNFLTKDWTEWIPKTVGIYKIYMDVKDSEGNIVTSIETIEVRNRDWKFDGIELNQKIPVEIGVPVKITPDILGNTNNLEYKYVWMKDDWNEWGVIKEFSDDKSCLWAAEEAGQYKIYVDVREKGREDQETVNISLEVVWGTWNIAGVSFDLLSPQIPGTTVELAARIIGNKTGLQYKFVWMKDSWDEWGIIQEKSSNSKASWMSEEPGNYKLYVDVFDKSGKTVTFIQDYEVLNWIIETKPLQQAKVGDSVSISLAGISHNKNMQYKYVWMKDDWNEWGVLQDFTDERIITWIPQKAGEYYLYVDVKNEKTNEIETQRIRFYVDLK